MSFSWNPRHWFFGQRRTSEENLHSSWLGLGPLCVLIESWGY